MKKSKILVGTPIYSKSKPFLELIFQNWLLWSGQQMDHLVVINGPLDPDLVRFFRHLKQKYPVHNLHYIIQPTGYFDGWGGLTKAQNTILNYCLSRNYSHLLFHEISRLPEPQAFASLMKWDKPVIGALYEDTYHPDYYCVYDFDVDQQLHRHDSYTGIEHIKKPIKVFGVGFGFTLINRQVLQRIKFRSSKFAADTYFYLDMRELCIPVYAAPVFAKNLKRSRSNETSGNVEFENEHSRKQQWTQRTLR